MPKFTNSDLAVLSDAIQNFPLEAPPKPPTISVNLTTLTEIRDTLSTALANLPTPVYDSPIGHNIDYCIGQIEQILPRPKA